MIEVPTIEVAQVPDPIPEGVTVIDVREPVEWQHGHIEGATHIPLHDLPGRVSDVPEGQTIVVCKVGARSAQAVLYLGRLGHDVVNLGGGLVEWEAAGRPLVSETAQAPQII